MGLQFAVLASGSRGNASLIRSKSGQGLVIDCGLGARDLTRRLEEVGASWDALRAVLLTHTHGDHVTIAALSKLVEHRIAFYCHEGHRPNLSRFDSFHRLDSAGLVRTYDDRPFLAPCGFRVEPIELSHDGGPTFGFRVEAKGDRRSRPSTVGYLTDSGTWNNRIADALAEVDLLGVEFNHDVDLQRDSGRDPWTIARNLGPLGHLSNDQGAALVSAVFERSQTRAPRHLVLLHISEQCNQTSIALKTARLAVRNSGRSATVHIGQQGYPSPNLIVRPGRGNSMGKLREIQARQEMLSLPF